MPARKPIPIPVVSAERQTDDPGCGSSCSETEIVALMVLGDSMEPEFVEGEILVIEMGVPAEQDWFVIAWANEEHIFRQLKRDAQGGWLLHALNPAYPAIAIPSLQAVKGVVIHKNKPGSRRPVKYYVE